MNEDKKLQPFEKPAPDPNSPVCPYCGADPIQLQIKAIVTPDRLTLVLVTCANIDCRKVVPVNVRTPSNVGPVGLIIPS
jgi:hypothetical protein